MNCDCTEKISLLIDEELSTVEATELERHLQTCVECQAVKADFLSLRNQITDFPVAFRPVAQREAFDRILGNQKTPARAFSRWVFNPAFAVVASLLVVGTIIALLVYPRFKPAPSPANDLAMMDGKKKSGQTPGGASTNGENRKPNNPGTTPQKKSATPAPEKNRTPTKKRAPLMFEPAQDNIAEKVDTDRVRSADAETMTAIHLEKSELLLRSFRNVRLNKAGMSPELGYEKKLAQRLVYQNMMLRREADASGDAQVASLLETLEPILLDIANLPNNARPADVKTIRDRVERKNIVALLQVNSTALARALD